MSTSFAELAGLGTCLSLLWAFALYLLSGKFVSKAVYDADKEKCDLRITAAERRADECHNKHDLMSQPMSALTSAVTELKSAIETLAGEASSRHEAMMAKLGELHTRTTVLEKTSGRRTKR